MQISTCKSYLGRKMSHQAPKMAFSEIVAWGPKMKSSESRWNRLSRKACGSRLRICPFLCQNPWVFLPKPWLVSKVMRFLSSLLLPRVFVQPSIDFLPLLSRRPKSCIFNWSFSAKEQTGLLPNWWAKMSREKPSPSVLLAANENKPLSSLSQLLSLLHRQDYLKCWLFPSFKPRDRNLLA